MNKIHALFFSLLVLGSLTLLTLSGCSSSPPSSAVSATSVLTTVPAAPPNTRGISAATPTSTSRVNLTTTAINSPTASPNPGLPSTTPIPPGSIAASGQKVVIDLITQNMAFDKSVIKVPPGSEVTIIFNNKDTIGHNFAVYTDQTAKTPVFVGKIINGPATINYTFTAPTTPGSYLFNCVPHAGFMKGQLVVQ